MHMFVCVQCVALQYIVYTLFFICALCAQSYNSTHACRCVSAFICFNVSRVCAFTYLHMPLCQREKVGVSIFPSPFFGDNDGHFFFSVTDDRQN